jgi:hypothetical protein
MRIRAKEHSTDKLIKRLEDFREEIFYLLGRYEYLKDKFLNKREAKEFKALIVKIKKLAN